MKNKLIRIISLLIAAVMTVSLIVGCSGGDDEAEDRSETADTADSSEEISETEDETETEDAATTVSTDTETEPVTDTETDLQTATGTESETEPQTETETETETTEPETTVPVTTAPETTAPVTTAPETTAPVTTAPETTVPVTTAPETTVPETTAPETTEEPKNRTAAPEVLGTSTLGSGRVLVYGSAEPYSVIRTTVNGGNEMKNRCKDKYFYIEVNGVSGTMEVSLYATADGKSESKATKTNVTDTGESREVWGGKDSRLFYMPTLGFLTGNRADTASIDQLSGYITKKTIKDIQKVTGKKTKLIFAIIPDPATGYYNEHFKYVQDYVLNPSTSAMMTFVNKISGLNEDVYAVDLLKVFRDHKDESIYFSTDTHYTELGAYYAYLEIMKVVQKDNPSAKVRSVKNGDYTVEYIDVDGGDLCGMAGISMREVVPFFIANFSDTGSYYVSKRNDGIKSAGFGPSGWERNSTLNDSNNPTAYFIADSYGCYILPFIGANFSKVWTNEGVLWSYELNQSILAQNKPDYVIMVVCQRNLSPNFMDSGNLINRTVTSVSSFEFDD